MRARTWSRYRHAKRWPQSVVMSCSSCGEVADHLVDAVHAERREVIAESPEIALRIREKLVVHVPLDHLALDLQARAADLEERVGAREERRLVAAIQIAQASAIQRDDAEGSGLLGGAEKAVAALQQLAQIELEPAAHRPDHVGLQVRFQEVLKVRQPVFRRHLEERIGERRVPREVGRDVVGRDGKGEHAALRIAGHHHFDVGAVDHCPSRAPSSP